MFHNDFKKVIATILLFSIAITSNGFFTLANSVQDFVNDATKTEDEEPKNYYEMYYKEEYYEESIAIEQSESEEEEGSLSLPVQSESEEEGGSLSLTEQSESEEEEGSLSLPVQNESEEGGSHSSPVQENEEGSLSLPVQESEGGSHSSPVQENEEGSLSSTEQSENEGGSLSLPVQEESHSSPVQEATLSSTEQSESEEEGSLSLPVQESEEGSHSSPVQENSLLQLENIASKSNFDLAKNELFGAPGDPDWSGEHVHKECGVASGSDCVHTEYAAHGLNAGLDYKKLEFDDHFGEFIDDFAGWTMVGEEKVAIDHPEYYYLTEDVTFIYDDTAPTDQGTNVIYYTIDLQRDLYLCLNGHTLTNFTFKSTGNKKLIITDCAGGGTIRSVEEEALMFNLPVKIFGLNEKIKINATRVAALNTQALATNTTFYNVIFDGTNCPSFDYSDDAQDQIIRLYYNNTSLDLKFENCDITNWGKIDGSTDVNSTGNMLLRFYTTGKVTFNNLKVYNNVGMRQNLFYADNSTNVIFKGRNEFYDNLVESTNTGNPHIFNFIGNGSVHIQGDGLYIHDNKHNKPAAAAVFVNIDGGGSFNVEENATFAFDNNILPKTTNTNSTLFIYTNKTFNCYGNLSITNNSVINCEEITTGTWIAALRVFSNKQIKIGDGLVTISGNKSYKDDMLTPVEEGKFLNHHMTQVYGNSKDMSCVFEMLSGKKFNPNNRIEGIGFPNGQVGKIMKWTNNEVDDLSIVSTVFKADNFYFPDYEVGVDSDYAKPIHNQSHRHKICGVAEGTTCTHGVEIATHTEAIGYSELRSEFSVSNAAALIKGLATSDAEAHFYLTQDIISDTLISIPLNRNVHLCLNGHTMKNITFTGSSKKLYITNCSSTISEMQNDLETDSSMMFNNNCVQVYGINKNIRIKGKRLFTTNTINSNGSVFYNIECDGTGLVPTSTDIVWISVENTNYTTVTFDDILINNYNETFRSIFWVEKRTTINIRDVKAFNNTGLNSALIMIGNSTYNAKCTVNFNGDNEFYNNTNNFTSVSTYTFARTFRIDKGNVYINGILNIHDNHQIGYDTGVVLEDESTFTVSEGGTFKYNNNIIDYYKSNMHIFDCYNGSSVNILGNFELVANKIYNCNEAASFERLAAFVRGNTANVYFGNGKITIKDNATYSDEGITPADEDTYKNFHMYQVFIYVDYAEGAFKVADGKKFNTESRIEGIAFRNAQAGKILKWTSETVDTANLDKYSECFTADTFMANYTIAIINDLVALIDRESHSHKICGVASTATCTHTETAAHTDAVNYVKLSDSLSLDLKLQLIAGVAETEAPIYLYLENDLVSDSFRTVSILRNVYICLNGHSITNIQFSGSGKKIYVTNCQDTKSLITQRTSVEYLFYLNCEVYGKKIADDYNICLNSHSIGLVTTTRSVESKFYCVDIDGTGVIGESGKSRFYLYNAGTVILEDVKIRDLSAASQVAFNHDGANGTLILKNIEMTNISYINLGFLRNVNASGKTILKGYNKIHDNNITTSAGSTMEHLIYVSNGKMIIEENATLEICDNIIPRHPSSSMFLLSVYSSGNGTLDARAGSKINIHDNVMYKAAKDNGIIGLFKATEHNFLGNVIVENNKFYNCNSSNTGGEYIAGLAITKGATTNIGSGSIIIKDNNAYSDEGVTPAGNTYYAHHVYGVMSGNADLTFTQKEGTKFNTNSRIENIAFKGAVTGKIMKWTNETVEETELSKFSECFTADTYFVDDYVIKKKDDYVVVASFDEHEHKVCGVASGSACLHTEIAAHTDAFSYSKIDSAALSNVDNFIKIFTGSSDTSGELYVYLSGDITVTSLKSINPTRPVNLCLNGHMMSGFRFIGSNKVTITNCKPEMGTFREILDTNICFQANTYLYGINRNLTINSPRIADIGGAYATTNTELIFYSTIFNGIGSKAGEFSTLYFNNDKKSVIKAIIEDCMFTNFTTCRMICLQAGNSSCKVVFKNLDIATSSITKLGSNVAPILYTNLTGAPVYFKGRNRIWNITVNNKDLGGRTIQNDSDSANVIIQDEGLFIENVTWSGSKANVLFFSRGKFTIEENATLSIKNCNLNKNASSVTYICELQGTRNIKGNLIVADNNIKNCGTNNTSYMSALRLDTSWGSVNLGNGKIVVEGNKSYKDNTTLSDDKAYPAQHMYQLFAQSSVNPLFKMLDGTKINPESKIDGIAINSSDSRGKIVEWNDTTYTNVDDHANIFIPDRFLNERLSEGVEDDGYVWLNYGDTAEEKHIHMVCGKVHALASCSHTEEAKHNEDIEYYKIGDNVLKYRFADLLGASSSGKPLYFYLTANLTSAASTQISFKNDVYICLNGFSITGYTFYSANGSSIYITNCKETVSKVENTTANNTMLFRMSTQIYGIDKNISVRSGSLITYEAKKVVFYDVLFDNAGRTSNTSTTIIHTSTEGANFGIEKCKFVNFETGLEMFGTSAKNVTFVLKDTEFEKCNNMASRFIRLQGNASARSNFIFKGENSIHDCVWTTDNKDSGAIFLIENSNFIVKEGGSFKFYNNQLKSGNRDCILWLTVSNLTVEKNASFEMCDNLIYQARTSGRRTTGISINDSSTNSVDIYGDLKVTGNKVGNCTYTEGSYIAAVELRGGVINIGTGSITIKDNTSGSNEDGTGDVDDTVRCQHMFNLYAANTNNIFKVKDGAKINPNSRIDATFFDTKDGKIMKWDDTTTDDLSAYRTIFTTDTYGDEEGMEILLKDGYVAVASRDNEHWHKICGVATDSTCTHTLAAIHTEGYQYTRIHKTTTETEFINILQGASSTEAPQYLFLKKDYTITGGKTIDLKRNVYLCLNGYSITNAKFTGNGKKIYICNCKEGVVSTVASNQDTNIFARTGIEVYGIDKNITISSGRVIDVTDTYNNPTTVFYDINMTGKDAPGPTSNVFEFVKANATMSFEKVNLDTYKSGHRFINMQSNNSNLYLKDVSISNISGIKDRFWSTWTGSNSARNYWHFYGNVSIDNVNSNSDSTIHFLDWSSGTFNIYNRATLSFTNCTVAKNVQFMRLGTNGKLNINEGGTVIIDNNTINYISHNQEKALIYLEGTDTGVELNVLGNLQITNNKYVDCGTITSKNPIALRVNGSSKTMKVGSGWMKIYGNRAYSDAEGTIPVDDTTYPQHHFFGAYFDNKNVPIVQEAGTKFNATESQVDNFSFSSIDFTGKIMKWTTNEVDESYIGRFKDVFKVDTYWDTDLETKENEDYGVVIYGDPKHRHKLCGVSTDSVCRHNNIVNHTDAVGYRNISKMYTTRDEVKALLQTGGAFALTDDFDTRNLEGSGDKFIAITPANDLYICLNGYSLNGLRFVGATNRNVYITNCKNTTASFSNDISSHAMFLNISGEIYGIDKNISIKYDVLSNTTGANNQNIRLYSASFSECSTNKQAYPYIALYQTSDQTSFIEDCEFSNIDTTYFLENDTARTFVFKDNTFHDMNLDRSFMDFDSGAVKVRWTGTNEINNIKYANAATTYFMRFASYAANEIKVDGNLKITNSSLTFDMNHFVYVAGGRFGIEENANLEIKNNTLRNSVAAGKGILYIGSNAHMYLHGTLDISDNRFTGTRKSHSDVGLWYTNKTESIEIGSGSIIIRNNTTANANANVRNLYSYYGGETSEESVISIFKQKTGTKFDAINSRIDSVAINSEEYTGVIYPSWTSANVEGSEIVNFDTVFKADTYGGRKGLVLDVEENNVIIKLADHYHKICGVPETEECKHTLIGSHGIGDTDDIKKLYRRLTWTTRENLIEQLENGGGMFLMRSVNFATPSIIDLKNDLYLCLGNYYIENAIFTSSTGHKAYITSCAEEVEQPEEEEEEPEYDEYGNPISTPESSMGSRRNDRNEVAIVATSSEAGAIFNLDVEVYSPYNILNIYANKLYENESGVANHRIALNGVTFKNDEKTASNYNYVSVNVDNELLLDGVSTDGLTNVNNIIDASNTNVEIAGYNNIVNNEINGSIFNTEGATINQEDGTINVSDNVFLAGSAESAAVKVTNNSNLKGVFIATSNEFIKSVETSKTSIIRVYNSDLNIGDEVINISDNGDAFGIYSDKQGFMKQLDTTTFNSLNYIENIALVNTSGNLISGAVTANDNFTLSNDIAEKSFNASTVSDADYRAYKGANNNIVIGVRKLSLDFNAPDGTTLLNEDNYSDEYNIAGTTESTISDATFKIGNYIFLGWATTEERAENLIVDVEDGKVYDTPFDGENDKLQSFTLYGVWMYNPHIHKICGTATDSECDHDITHLAAHTEVIEYEPLLDTLTTLESGRGYNLTASSSESVKRVFTIDGTVYICLNGYALYNVQFLPRTSTCKIVICNCSDHEAKVTRNDEASPTYPGMFNHINTSIYGTGNRINFETDVIIDRSGGGYNQTVEIYNAHFSPVFGFEYTGDRALMYQENGGDRITISNTTFEGYKTTRLLSNHFDPLYTHSLPVFGLYNSSIIRNTITGNGAIQNDYGTLNIENVRFEDNILTDTGRLICQDRGNGTISIKGSYIRRTNADTLNIGDTIYNAVGTTSIINSLIEYNKADRIINAVSGNVNIDATYINDNAIETQMLFANAGATATIGGSHIKNNILNNGRLIDIYGATINIKESSSVSIYNNELQISESRSDSLISFTDLDGALNVKGDLFITNNIASGSVIKTSNDISAISIYGSNQRINLGSGRLYVANNKSNYDVSTLNHMYGIYSKIESFMYQMPETSFNLNNYIEEIALVDTSGTLKTGNIMADNNFTFDTKLAEKSFKASTISNAEYRAYKGTPNNIVIGVRKLYLDFNIPEETTLIDDEHYQTEYNIAGTIKASMSKATFKVDKFVFMGWATSKNRATNSIVDVKDGGLFDTPFDAANDKAQEFYLYGVWRYDDDPHIHKICGTSTDSECAHDIDNLSIHSHIVEYRPLFDYMTNLESGRGYYLVATSSVTRTFTITGTVYICLNGFEISNVAFKGANENSTVYICNCKKDTVMTQNEDEYMFSDINTFVYGANGRIDMKTKSLISLSLYSGQNAEFYNIHMSPKTGYINDNAGSGIVTQNNQNNIVKISNSTFEGYNTHILLLNNDSSHGSSLVGLYNSVFKNNNINGFGMIFNNHGSFVVENTMIDNNILKDDGHIIYQAESGIIDISSSSIARTNNGTAKIGNMIYNDVGTINMSNSKVENNNVVAILNEFEGNFNISGNSDFVNNSVERTIFNIHDNGTMTIEENANINISNNELQVSENRLDSVVYLSSTNPTLELIGNVNITGNIATGSVTKTANAISAIGIDNSTNAKINLGAGKIIIKDNISNNTAAQNNFYGIYSKAERFMYQSAGTTFNAENYVEEIALVDTTGNLKTGKIMVDNNYKLDSSIVEKSFKASTISNADYRVYKGANESIVIGARLVYYDYNVPEGQVVTAEKIATVNMAGRVTLETKMLDIDTEECVFLGWAYEKLEVGESDAILDKVKIVNGGTLDMPIDVDTRGLYGVWKKTYVYVTFEPNEPESPNSSYRNELISELKTAVVATISEVHNELLIMDSPYEITGYTFKGWALSTMSTVDADSYVLEPEYQPGTILTYEHALSVRPSRRMTLYALWVRDTYTLTLHANDEREGNGSTKANIAGFATDTIKKEVEIRYDTYMSEQANPLPMLATRSGYNFSNYWVEEKDIALKDRATYSDTHKDTSWDNTKFYRRATSAELYALWINKEYDFTVDNRGQEFIDTTFDGVYDGSYYRSKVLFDDTLTLPKAKSNDNRMAFDYYGAEVDKGVFEILGLSDDEYNAYKVDHEVENNFIYCEEAEKHGRATISAVYYPVPVSVIFDSKENDAAFKDKSGNYIKEILATLSYGKRVSEAFDDGKIATPYRPGYKVSKWVLASDSSVEIKEDTKWIYEDKTKVEAIYELVSYTIVYMPGDGEGTEYTHLSEVNFENEVLPQYNNEFKKFGMKVVGFDILNGSLGTDSEITHKVSSVSVTNWKKTNRVMLKDKFTNAYPNDGNILKLKAVYDDAGTYVRYNKSTPNSVDSSYKNEVKGIMEDSWIDIASISRISENQYTLEGYEFIGWSRTPVTATAADTIDVTTLYQGRQVVPYEDVKNDRHILDLYAVWKRKIYNFTFHINDKRESNGSTEGLITGLMPADQTIVTIPVKYDEYFGVSVATSGSARVGYTLKGFTERQNIEIKEKATYSNVWTSDSVVRITTGSELYALWQNNTYKLRTDLRGQTWEDTTLPAGDIIDKEIYFDDVIDKEVLPNAKSTTEDMRFDYWGVDIDKTNNEILVMSQEEYNAYKTAHERAKTFTYSTECERDGFMTFTAVYAPRLVNVKFTAKESDAAMKDKDGNYISEMTVTLPSGWVIGTAFEGGNIATPYRPGHKFNRWVLASDSSVVITKDTKWIYGDNGVVEAVYDIIPYTIVYMPGEGSGANYTHHEQVDYSMEIRPEYDNQFTYFGKKVVGFEILNGSLGTDSEITHKVSSVSVTNWKKTNRVMLKDKFTNAYPNDGNVLKLRAIYDEAGMVVKYHKSTPTSIDSRYTNEVRGNMPDGWIDAEKESRIDESTYSVLGYEFIGWSKATISVVEADTIDVSTLYQGNQVVAYDTVRNDKHILDLYAVWKRKTYNWTFHINDSRENNGSTKGSITGLMDDSQVKVTIPVKYDEYLGVTVATTGSLRPGYTLKGFTTKKDIALSDRETYADVYTIDTFVRSVNDKELYTLWLSNKYYFDADLCGQEWEDPTHPDGNIIRKEILFDAELDKTVLPNVKSTTSTMEFNYWGVNVDKTTSELLNMSEADYKDYKSKHIKNDTFTYYEECEDKGFVKFTAVFIPAPVEIIFDAKVDGAGFKDSDGDYVKQIIATTSTGWTLGSAFDDGEMPTVYRPGYKVSKWVLKNDESIEVTKNTAWNREDGTVVEPIYEVVNYKVEYYPGEAGGKSKQGTTTVNCESEFVPESNVFDYKSHKFAGWKVLNPGKDISGNVTMEVAKQDTSTWTKTNIINSGYKAKNLFAEEGDTVKLEAIWDEAVYNIEYVRKAPNSVNASYTNEIKENAMDIVTAGVGDNVVIADYAYTTTGYTMIGWSTNASINYDDYVLGKEETLVNYKKGDKVVLSNTEGELIKLYPVWKRNEYSLEIKYPKYATAIKEKITFRYDTYVNNVNIILGRDYKGEAYRVLAWSLKDPGDAHYDTIEEALADTKLADSIANVNNKVVFRNQSDTLYSISRQDCIEFVYYINRRGGTKLSLENNPSLKQYILNSDTGTFTLVKPVWGKNKFDGWERDGKIIPARSKSSDNMYYKNEVTVDPTTLKKSWTYELVAKFSTGNNDRPSNGGGGGGGGGGRGGGGVGGNFTGWTYDLVGWSYYGYDQNSSMSEKYANGIFKIDIGDGKDRYYGFDNKGYMVSGFNNFYGCTYLFNEDSKSVDYGSLIFDSVIMNGNKYTIHPNYGELIGVDENIGGVYSASKTGLNIIDGSWNGNWEVNPVTGQKTYVLRNGVRELPVNGSVEIGGLYYVFDKEGIMQTGFIKYRGQYYYMVDEGPQSGVIYIGYKNVGGVELLFDPILGGRLVHEEMLKEVKGVEAKVISEGPGLDLKEN